MVETDRVRNHVLAIDEPVARQDVHDTERQGRVGADPDLQMPVGELRGAALARVDDDDWHAALLRHLGLGPEMHIGGDEVGTPGDYQVAIFDRLGVSAADGPDRHVPRFLAAGVAHSAGDQPAGAERMKQPEHQAAVQLPLVRAIGIAEQCQRPGLGDDRPPPPGNLVERLVPADRREFALALRPNPAQRRPDALGRMHQLGVAIDLGAGKAGGEGLLRVALDAQYAPVLDLGQ